MSDSSSRNVTLIGLGAMGSALGESLLNHGYRLTVWNRSAGKADRLADRGATYVADAAEAVSMSPVTVVCVSDHDATVAVLGTSDLENSLDGRTLVQLSTVTSDESRALGERVTPLGARYLDGQILSYPDDVLEGRAVAVCSGPRGLYEEFETLLTDMCGHPHHVGEKIGAAPTFDKAHLSFSMGNYLVFIQAAAMCARSGVDLKAWCDFNLKHLADGHVHRELSVLADQMCKRSYDDGLDASMDVWLGAIRKTIEECDASGVSLAHLESLGALAETAVGSGGGEKELGILFEQLIADRH